MTPAVRWRTSLLRGAFDANAAAARTAEYARVTLRRSLVVEKV
jgi:hypothetical protein